MNTKIGIGAILVGFGILAGAPPVHAQTTVEAELTPLVGGTFFTSDLPRPFLIERRGRNGLVVRDGQYKNAVHVGMAAGLRIDEQFAIEGFIAWIPTELEYAGEDTRVLDADGVMYSLSALYHFDIERLKRVVPFLGIGIGGETFNYDLADARRHNHFMTNLIAGATVPMNDRVGVRVEARDCIAWFDPHVEGRDLKVENDLMLSVGLAWRLPIRGG